MSTTGMSAEHSTFAVAGLLAVGSVVSFVTVALPLKVPEQLVSLTAVIEYVPAKLALIV